MYTKEIKALFGKEKLSIPNFKKAIKHLPLEEQQLWKEKIFITSFCYYTGKGKTIKAFLRTFIKSYRQEYLDYILQQTLLGQERYQPHDGTVRKKIVSYGKR